LKALTTHRVRLAVISLILAVLTLAGCQTAPPAKGLTAQQVAVLKQQGFKPTDEGWAFDLSGKVLFGSNVDVLNDPSRVVVERIGRALLGAGINGVRIDGHTDASGKTAYNEQLSLRRAHSVAVALINIGMAERDIQQRGLGSREPVATNDTPEGRTENRRVAIVVVSQ